MTGSHAFAGRLVAHPRTLELREHVQVRGPATRLDGALNAFADHICASAVTVHASKEHFVVDLEVFTGDGDAFDDEAHQFRRQSIDELLESLYGFIGSR